MRVILVPLLFLASFAAGCGAPCAAACEKIYGDGDGECNIQIPGKTGESGRQEMIGACMDHCRNAMAHGGEVGDYDPEVRTPGGDAVALENRKQAELWMDCVTETSCENLDENYCAPVKNFP
jgi:hypothetical protein